MDLNDQQTADAYATLRVSLRQAILRVSGVYVSDVSTIFRDIESGAKVGPVTDALERLLRDVCDDQVTSNGLPF